MDDVIRGTSSVDDVIRAAEDDDVIGGTFRVGWKMQRDGFIWKHVKTRLMSFDETAVNVRRILQEDLSTGDLVVSRLGPDKHRGYTWFVTFVEFEGTAPPLTAYR